MSRSLGHVVLNGARDILKDPANWIQGAEHEDDGFCIDGAIIESARKITKCRKGRRAAARDARRLVYAQTGFRCRNHIWRWNDDKERTHAEVVALLDRCA